jgi:hypothetical protein
MHSQEHPELAVAFAADTDGTLLLQRGGHLHIRRAVSLRHGVLPVAVGEHLVRHPWAQSAASPSFEAKWRQET